MRPEDKKKREATHVRRPYKTKGDFLRWLREKKACQKQLAQKDITQAERAISQALAVWADDGGATG
jgi:hypothetical protein